MLRANHAKQQRRDVFRLSHPYTEIYIFICYHSVIIWLWQSYSDYTVITLFCEKNLTVQVIRRLGQAVSIRAFSTFAGDAFRVENPCAVSLQRLTEEVEVSDDVLPLFVRYGYHSAK